MKRRRAFSTFLLFREATILRPKFSFPKRRSPDSFALIVNKELKSTHICELYQAPTIPMRFPSGGIIQICSGRGSKKHLIEFEKLESELLAFYNKYAPFH